MVEFVTWTAAVAETLRPKKPHREQLGYPGSSAYANFVPDICSTMKFDEERRFRISRGFVGSITLGVAGTPYSDEGQ